MLAIKLSRIGKKNQPHYRVIITEKGRDPFGDVLETLGDYNPHTKALQIKGDRVNYWISKGAQPTPTVNNLLVEKGIIKGEKVRASKDPKNTEVAPAEEAKKEEGPKAEAEIKEEVAPSAVEKPEEIKPEAVEVKEDPAVEAPKG